MKPVSFEQTVRYEAFLATQQFEHLRSIEPGEPKGTLYPVEMNGYKVKIPKNVYVDVPKPIATL